MIKELIQFTALALEDPVYRSLGVIPKEGLHIILKVEKSDEQTTIAELPAFSGVYSAKKTTEISEWLLRCTDWWKASTMLGVVDTFKVFDVPSKAIHTVSPFCFAVKRTNLEGGEQYAENQSKSKSQVYDRINAYFTKAVALLELSEDKVVAEAFRIALNNKTLIHHWLEGSGYFQNLKDGEYVVFYLDLPLEKYNAANRNYLKEKLFNKAAFNVPDENDPEILHGTSNWLNGFSSKKAFLTHQSATFDISGRVSSQEAQMLYEFTDLSRRKLFPNPLPLFVIENERKKAFKIFKEDAMSGEEKRKTYLEVIHDLQKEHSGELGNYYLLFLHMGEIKDFDYVSRFEFNLNYDGSPWRIDDLFNINTGQEITIHTVTDLMTVVLPPMFNNALVVRRKDKGWIFHWFDEMDPSYCKTHNAFLLAMKYRKAFYDFIYKSKRQGVTGEAIREILTTGILDDIRLDNFKDNRNSENLNIRLKLNLLFNLHQYFSTKNNPTFMPDNITQLREHLDRVATGSAQLETDEHFAFAAGQVIYTVSKVSMSEDKSYKYLEPFLSQSNPERFKLAIGNFIKRYKHAEFSPRFRSVCADVLTYTMKGDFQKQLPILLAGIFSKEQLHWEKKEKSNAVAPESLTESN
jgi:CRISPR-associated protein Csh1